MFTGIVAALGTIRSVTSGDGANAPADVSVLGPWNDLELGESVAVDGACLTVTTCGRDGIFRAQASAETLGRTTLGRKRPGDTVHLERALRMSDRLGGHFVTGHVDAVGRVTEAQDGGGGTRRLIIEVPRELASQLVAKGSVAVDGVSLTVNEVWGHRFTVMIVAHTAAVTKLGSIQVGAEVNVETDLIAKYVERALGREATTGGVTMDLLERTGFVGGERGR